MLAIRTPQFVSTICHLCGDSGSHDTPNLCEECHTRIPFVTNTCSTCSLPMDVESSRCGACLTKPPTYDSSLTVLRYQKPVDIMFNRLKHHRDITVAATFAKLLSDKIRASGTELPDIIIPIPLSWKRQLSRGFNQSQCIAMLVAGNLGVAVDTKALTRVTSGAPQQGLSRSERLKNLDRCFTADKSVRNKRIALLDDVVTTGATMEAAATALYIRGSRSIAAWSVARTPDQR